MFENIIEQGAASRLQNDILCKRNAPSMLFFGPSESGKGSTALELARVLSCEEDASWKCSCSSCERHRYLKHDDLLVLGNKSFLGEINACCFAFLNNPSNINTKLLFYRSLRKLQIRFSPVLIEDDPKSSKISSVLLSFDEGLNDFLSLETQTVKTAVMEKLCRALVKDAATINDEGISSNIPINQIRSASYWCHLAPVGNHKTLIIENAQNMREDARNSLLKLLEEPPSSVSIVLTSLRRQEIIPTILSRLRQYRFLKRSVKSEEEILRRVFHADIDSLKSNKTECSVNAYLDSFLDQNREELYPLAAWFIVTIARITALAFKRTNNGKIPLFISTLGERYAQIAETSSLERSVKSSTVVKTLLSKSGSMESETFTRFLKLCLDMVGSVAREASDPQYNLYNDIFKKYIGDTASSVNVLNQSTTIALEALLYNLKNTMINSQKVY